MGIRVCLADDHRCVIEGLRNLLEKPGGMEVIGAPADGRAAVQSHHRELKPERSWVMGRGDANLQRDRGDATRSSPTTPHREGAGPLYATTTTSFTARVFRGRHMTLLDTMDCAFRGVAEISSALRVRVLLLLRLSSGQLLEGAVLEQVPRLLRASNIRATKCRSECIEEGQHLHVGVVGEDLVRRLDSR